MAIGPSCLKSSSIPRRFQVSKMFSLLIHEKKTKGVPWSTMKRGTNIPKVIKKWQTGFHWHNWRVISWKNNMMKAPQQETKLVMQTSQRFAASLSHSLEAFGLLFHLLQSYRALRNRVYIPGPYKDATSRFNKGWGQGGAHRNKLI